MRSDDCSTYCVRRKVVTAFQYHGNWGGPGRSDSRFTTPGVVIDFTGAFTDVVDEKFLAHDELYYDAEEAYKISARSDADKVQYWKSNISADTAFQVAMKSL